MSNKLQIPQIDINSAKQFADRWNKARPIALLFKDHELQFAVDLANFVLADSFKQAFGHIMAQQQKPQIEVVSG